jgi:hypothetical protein
MARKFPPDQTSWPSIPVRAYELLSNYGNNILTCSLTILLMDDKLGRPLYDYGNGQSIWFVLESIGAFAPRNACITLITSDCAMKEYLGRAVEGVYPEIANGIYLQSLPLFRKRIESGRVRLSILNHDKYSIPRSSEYSSSNNALMNRYFWEDEFERIDSDQVLIMDRNSALCYPLVMDHMTTDYAWIGSVWPKVHNPLQPDFLEGPCREMAKSWRTWLWPQRKYKHQQHEALHSGTQPLESWLRDEFPTMCEGYRAPVGGGGMSLRSRKWMIQAIETCPHVVHSGMLKVDTDRFYPCKVFDPVNEDYYFATLLQGIDAPLPSAYSATLFSAEVLWPDEVFDVYPAASAEQSRHDLSLAADRPKITSIDGEMSLVIPNGVHNVWWYHPEEMLRAEVMVDSCPFLPYIYDTHMNRYEEFSQQKNSWVGVGS